MSPELAELATSAGVQVLLRHLPGARAPGRPRGRGRGVGGPRGPDREPGGGGGGRWPPRRAEGRTRRLDPVVVHRTDAGKDTTVALGGTFDPARAWVTLRHEHGASAAARVSEVAPGSGGAISLRAFAGGRLAAGYHQLVLEVGGREEEALVISAPRCPPARRSWGLFLPLYALRTEGDWGVGSYPDLAELGRFTGAAGGSFVGTLPLYPGFLGDPADPSPYRPVTRLGYNELYVDPAAIHELAGAPEARRVLESDGFSGRVRAAHDSQLVPYEALAVLRRRVLEPLARRPRRRRRAGAVRRDHPELVAYAAFRAAGERHGQDWRPCGPPGGRRGTDAVLGDPAARYHLCAQWLAHRQLAEAAGARPSLRRPPGRGRTPTGSTRSSSLRCSRPGPAAAHRRTPSSPAGRTGRSRPAPGGHPRAALPPPHRCAAGGPRPREPCSAWTT